MNREIAPANYQRPDVRTQYFEPDLPLLAKPRVGGASLFLAGAGASLVEASRREGRSGWAVN